jgi:sulfite exporter TauE/SafE
MSALLATVFLASLLGSAHCAAMCGALSLVASQGGRARLQASYHAGRVGMYALLGAVAGFVGHGIDSVGALFDVERAATIVVGVVLLLTLGMQLTRLSSLGAAVGRLLRHVAPADIAPALRALLLGVATALIPCGWLYAFLAIAAATGAPSRGAAVMAVFALGAIPILVGSAQLAKLLARTWLARRPKATAVLVALACITVFVVRGNALARVHASAARPDTMAPLVCHGDNP